MLATTHIRSYEWAQVGFLFSANADIPVRTDGQLKTTTDENNE